MCKSQNAENKVENESAGNLGGNAKNVGNQTKDTRNQGGNVKLR